MSDGEARVDFHDAATRSVTQPRWEGKTMSGADYLRSSEPPLGRIPHADYHVHWDHPEHATPGLYSPYESLATIDAMGITTGMLITNTYKAYLTPEMTVDELVDINRRYSDILSGHPHASKYQILCGVAFARDDAPAFAARCLDLPKVRGIKLRNFTVRSSDDLAKFESLVKIANERGALVLSHFGAANGPPGAMTVDLRIRFCFAGRFFFATLR